MQEHRPKNFITTRVILAGILVGTLDILAAIVLTLLNAGDPRSMLQFIASGVFGTDAFSGGWLYALYGLLFHYAIAMCWTIVFVIAARKMRIIRRFRFTTAITYSLLIWSVMNLLVLPLSNAPAIPLSLNSALPGILALIIAVGLPLSFLLVPRSPTRFE